MKNHLFVHQSNFDEHRSLQKAYASVIPTLKETGSSLFFDGAIGFSILSPTFAAADRVRQAFGWETIREVETGRFVTDDDIW